MIKKCQLFSNNCQSKMKSALNEKWIVCRVCLSQPKHEIMHTIFNNSEEKDLTQMIFECGGVPIKRYDHYPDKICTKCLKYLRVAYKFRVTCQRSHKHLSRFIAPVEVEKTENLAATTLVAFDMEEAEEIALKLEPEEAITIKQELCDEDAGVVDVYEPMEDDALTFDELAQVEQLEEPATPVSDEIEYLDDIGDELSTSDEEFIPNATRKVKKEKRSPKQRGTAGRGAVGRPKKLVQIKKEPRRRKPKDSSYICDICGNIYPSQGRLTEHIKLHKGIKPHECEICGYAFAQTQQLARHMNTHTGNRPYKCSYCPAAFADLSTRNKHHRIHTNERPYVCDVCGKSFTYTNTLKFHKMIHTGEKPHVCDICGKGFQQAYKLRNHKVTHEKKGIKLEKIEVEALNTMQEVNAATAHLLEI